MAQRQTSRAKKTYVGRLYLGDEQYKWVGRFPTKKERDKAVREAWSEYERAQYMTALPTCDEYVDRYLREYERQHKSSSLASATQGLKRFRADFAGRPLDSILRDEAKDWINGEGAWLNSAPVPVGYVPNVVTLFNHAIDEDDLPLERNPFRKLGKRGKGRSDQPPPTEQEFQKLLDACHALGEYAYMMRALILFCAYELMRPSEAYELAWTDIDFAAMRVHKDRRVYRGQVDDPKTGKKLIALTPPARAAIAGLPRGGRLVFTSKTGRRLSQSTISVYWAQVLAKAGLDFDFYHATKHYGVHYMWTKLGMSRRAIAAQAGWAMETVDKMLAIYGHANDGALEEVDAIFAAADTPNVVQLRRIPDAKAAL